MPTRNTKRNIKGDLEGLRPYLIGGRSTTRSYGGLSYLTASVADALYVQLSGENQASWIPNPAGDATQDITGHFNLAGAYLYKINGVDINNCIILFSGSSAIYANNDTGMAAAIAASGAGDTIWLSPCTLADDYTIPANVTVVGKSIEDVVFTGQITLSNGSALELLTILRSKNQAGAAYGIADAAGSITAQIKNIKVNVQNAGGPAYALYMANGGTIRVTDSELLAEVGTDGYAAYVTSGTLYQYGGRALGSTALYPYYT